MENKFTCIIIDDEELARQELIKLLTAYAQIKIIAEATSGQEGLKLIEKHQPDIIFLDLEMPLMNGFEMFSKLKKQPKVIFMTTLDEAAIKIFEEKSLDYLLKPFEEEALEKNIQKLNITHKPLAQPLKNLLDQFKLKL
jgi:two-component system LytT family response regulator